MIVIKMCRDFRAQHAQGSALFFDHIDGQFLIGKINRCFHISKPLRQSLPPILVKFAERAIELAQSLFALRLGFGMNQVGNRLGLGQIHLAVFKGAAGEFARFGHPELGSARKASMMA